MRHPVWEPTDEQRQATNLCRFIDEANSRWNLSFDDYRALYDWSVRQPEQFWLTLWDFADVRCDTRGDRVVVDRHKMPGARWFPDARLNYVENLLRRRDETDALVFWAEAAVRRRLSHGALYEQVARLTRALRALGVTKGDRVAGYLPNIPETIVSALAAASIGAVWSSCSPDFGVQGALDRFGQIAPKVLIAADGYFYGGKTFDTLGKTQALLHALPSVEHLIVVSYTSARCSIAGLRNTQHFADVVAAQPGGDIEFERVPFDHPLFIMFSSGTTGVPKCIVHGTGGTLLQHLKEHQLHCDVRANDRVFYFTTCGWMMWNWLISALATEATLLLYDGSPFHPDSNLLFDYADSEDMTLFGTSAKYIDAARKGGLEPIRTHKLTHLRTIASTGSPLVPESFDYVYEKIKSNVHLASMSGGTDIISCFAGGNPLGSVWRGELQARALGMQVDIFDDDGNSIRGQQGELVCTAPFPSMPVGFWDDPDGMRYHAAYFDRFPNVWHHGDWAELTEHDGMIIYGRSDAVLNPGGVRIGTAEIYRQVEQFHEVLEAVCVAQDWADDVRIVLFVRLRDGARLDDDLIDRIKQRIRSECSPRHVPDQVIQVADIPRTRSGKITELAVRDVIHGRAVKNIEALANPDALDLYRDLPALQNKA